MHSYALYSTGKDLLMSEQIEYTCTHLSIMGAWMMDVIHAYLDA